MIFYRPYVCELCGYKTAAPSTLNAHKRMVHEKQRPFVCETCGYSAIAKNALAKHIRLIHKTESHVSLGRNQDIKRANQCCNKKTERLKTFYGKGWHIFL